MDLVERCASCLTLFDTITANLKLTVWHVPERWTQDYCVGLVDLTKHSTLSPIDLMALNHTVVTSQSEERFKLVLCTRENNQMCLGIVHDRRPLEKGRQPTRTLSAPPPTWKLGDGRACLYPASVLVDMTHRMSKGAFDYRPIPESNLGQIICQDNPDRHRVFDLTEWMASLIRLGTYQTRGVWCYVNTRATMSGFAIEVVTDLEKLQPESGKEDQSHKKTKFQSNRKSVLCQRLSWFVILAIGLCISTSWSLLFSMPSWNGQ